MPQAIGILISALALSVAVYGIFERQRAAYANLRVQFIACLEQIEQLNVEVAKHLDEHPDENEGYQWTPGSFAGRRALLDLSGGGPAWPTEVRAETALRPTLPRDPERIREPRLLPRVVRRPDGRASSVGGSAGCSACTEHCAGGDLYAAMRRRCSSSASSTGSRECARHMVALASTNHGPQSEEAFRALLDWLGVEKGLGAEGKPEEPAEGALRLIESSPEELRPMRQMALRDAARLTAYDAEDGYREAFAGLDDSALT